MSYSTAMSAQYPPLSIETLGPVTVASPLQLDTTPGNDLADFVDDQERILVDPRLSSVRGYIESGEMPPAFELAGPRQRLFFDPQQVRAAIVTCGGLCPGLNNVIRALVMHLHRRYRVQSVLGIRYGLEGFISSYGHEAMELTPAVVESIHLEGGTILGSSRGPQEVEGILDFLVERQINVLFTVGGDGTFRAATRIAREAQERGLALAVVGVPKTIDNDIFFVERTFGYETAVAVAAQAIVAAHVEARGAPRGIGVVKLMGRHSGFIAASAALAARVADLVLVPEQDFELEGPGGVFAAVARRLKREGHFVVVVAEGAGQRLLQPAAGQDASGNVKLGDIGSFMADALRRHFATAGEPVNLKYIDPSYIIRAAPATPDDAIFCGALAEHAVHAALAGKTDLAVGIWGGTFTLVPLGAATSQRKTVDLEGSLWANVLESTGQSVSLGALASSKPAL
jgi:6-phosphofructokinase 1